MSQAEVEAIAGLGDMEDIMDGMDDLQHEEEVEEMRASQQAASQVPPPPPPPSRREPLAERQLDDLDLHGRVTALAEAANQADDVAVDAGKDYLEGDHEGDVTHQADFEVHMNVPEHDAADTTTGPDDTTAGDDEAHDTTVPVGEVDEIEDETLPATQHPTDDDPGVSFCLIAGLKADKSSSMPFFWISAEEQGKRRLYQKRKRRGRYDHENASRRNHY